MQFTSVPFVCSWVMFNDSQFCRLLKHSLCRQMNRQTAFQLYLCTFVASGLYFRILFLLPFIAVINHYTHYEVVHCPIVLVWRWYVLQVVLNCSVLSALEHLCKSNHESIRKEACWTVSNIAAGNKVQIQVSSTLVTILHAHITMLV